jgi:fatty acid desaturase
MTAPVAAHPSSDTTDPQNPLHKLSEAQLEELGRLFDDLHEHVKNDLGQRDADYIRGVIGLQRRLALQSRIALVPARYKPAWLLGTSLLSAAKILENMEIGHNVLHGQWDWMNDPVINSQAWDWDTASTAQAWRHSHNYVHHTYTNILGKDKDLGYEIMRIDPQQKWHPVYLLQPFYNVVLMLLFEWGVAFHDMDFEAIRRGEKDMNQVREELKGIAGKARAQIVKDYVGWPLVSASIMAGAEYAIDRIRGRSRTDRARSGVVAARQPDPAPARAGAAGALRAVVQAQLHGHAVRRRCGQPGAQRLELRDYLLRPLPRPGLCLHAGGDRGRVDRRALRAPADRRLQHRGRPDVPPGERQPRLPGRAPPLPGHAVDALRGDRAEGARDLRALRAALQHRAVPEAALDGAAHDRAPGVPRWQAAAQAGSLPR